MLIFRKLFAFLKRDFINEASYKFAFVGQLFAIFFSTLTFFFLSKLFGHSVSPYIEKYGGNYFSFVLVGIAFSSYLRVSLSSFADTIRNAQLTGTLEALLVTQTSVPAIILASSLYSFIFTSFRVLIYLLLGIFVFGIDMSAPNLCGALIFFILTILAFGSIGIVSASFVLMFKKDLPFIGILISLFILLGGVYYPIEVLPVWLQKISYFLPITHSLNGIRHSLLLGYPLKALAPNIFPLLIFIAVVLPFSLFLFRYAVIKAKVEGSLTYY